MRAFRPLLTLVALALCVTLTAQKTDTIHLHKGDLIVGEMKDLKLGLLRVSTDYMGTVFIEWDQIRTVRTDKRWYIRLRNGTYTDGSLADGPAPGQLHIRRTTDSLLVKYTDITTLYRLNQGIWPRTDGSINAGFSYQKNNGIAQFSLSGTAVYRGDLSAVDLSFNSITTTQPGNPDNRKQDITLGYERNLGGRWTCGFGVGAEANTELGLDLRLRANSSIGNYILLKVHASNIIGAGVQANLEQGANGVDSENFELFLADRFRFKTYRFPKAEATIDVAGYYGLTIRDRWRLGTTTALRYEVLRDLQLGIEFYAQSDSRPLDGSPALNDYRLATTVGYTF